MTEDKKDKLDTDESDASDGQIVDIPETDASKIAAEIARLQHKNLQGVKPEIAALYPPRFDIHAIAELNAAGISPEQATAYDARFRDNHIVKLVRAGITPEIANKYEYRGFSASQIVEFLLTGISPAQAIKAEFDKLNIYIRRPDRPLSCSVNGETDVVFSCEDKPISETAVFHSIDEVVIQGLINDAIRRYLQNASLVEINTTHILLDDHRRRRKDSDTDRRKFRQRIGSEVITYINEKKLLDTIMFFLKKYAGEEKPLQGFSLDITADYRFRVAMENLTCERLRKREGNITEELNQLLTVLLQERTEEIEQMKVGSEFSTADHAAAMLRLLTGVGEWGFPSGTPDQASIDKQESLKALIEFLIQLRRGAILLRFLHKNSTGWKLLDIPTLIKDNKDWPIIEEAKREQDIEGLLTIVESCKNDKETLGSALSACLEIGKGENIYNLFFAGGSQYFPPVPNPRGPIFEWVVDNTELFCDCPSVLSFVARYADDESKVDYAFNRLEELAAFHWLCTVRINVQNNEIWDDEKQKRRHRAAGILEKHIDEIEGASMLLTVIEFGLDSEMRKKAIAKLQQLGNKETLVHFVEKFANEAKLPIGLERHKNKEVIEAAKRAIESM